MSSLVGSTGTVMTMDTGTRLLLLRASYIPLPGNMYRWAAGGCYSPGFVLPWVLQLKLRQNSLFSLPSPMSPEDVTAGLFC